MTSAVARQGAARFGTVATAIGVAHFAIPRAFEPINITMFPANTRRHVYANGAIETALGLGCLLLGARRATKLGYGVYAGYLLTNLLTTQLDRTRDI